VVCSHTLTAESCHHLGYKRYYNSLKQFLLQHVDGRKLEIIPKEDPGTTGNFEVTVLDTGLVLHSKTTNFARGQSKAETDRERKAILNQIQVLIEMKEEDE
jgi:selT/selW/selH-like putative selenoprotein